MSKLFETTEIKGMKLANRFVRSATWEGMATEDGACTPRLVEVYRRLAEGQVGLIITSHAYVRKDGQAGLFQLGIYDDHLKDGLRQMVEGSSWGKRKNGRAACSCRILRQFQIERYDSSRRLSVGTICQVAQQES